MENTYNENENIKKSDVETGNEDFFSPNEDEKETTSGEVVRRIFFGVTALLLLFSMTYVYGGFQQMLFFRPTPPAVEQPFVGSVLNEETIVLPIRIFAVKNSKGGTWRVEEEIFNLVEQASRIWNQADITLVVEKVINISASDEDMEVFLYNPSDFIRSVEQYNPEIMNIFLTRRLGGINGIAFIGMNAAAVADITTNNDFTVLAHEIGHLLGLDHVPGVNRLMHQGSRGFVLIEEEILIARDYLKSF